MNNNPHPGERSPGLRKAYAVLSMKRRIWLLGVLAVVVVAGIAAAKHGYFSWNGAVAQAPRPAQRGVAVEVTTAVKKTVPVQIEVLGSVTPIANVAVKPRVDSEIVGVHFRDGATVKQGDLLFTLDSRTLEAQARQVEGLLASAKANLEQAERDVTRYTELLGKGATTLVTLQNARTQVNIWRAAVESNTAQLENLKIQIGYCTIRAPITGRASMAVVKVGNQVHQSDTAPLATIIQMAPIYVSFNLPQVHLPHLREALRNETASIEAVIPGDPRRAGGQVTMVENTVDAPTGTVPVRATMPNKDELLWPGTLVTVHLTFRQEEAVVLPSEAVQVSQNGTFVFTVKDGTAMVRPVTVGRVWGANSIIQTGLAGGETVVVNGQLLLSNGSKVEAREAKAGS